MTQRVGTYAWSSLTAALVVPSCLALWFLASYNGTNPDGSPDNAMAHALPGLVVLGGACSILGLAFFLVLGLLQRKRPAPSLRLALVATAGASLPLPVLLYFPAVAAPDPMPGGWWAVGGLFAYRLSASWPAPACSARGYGLTIHSSRTRFAGRLNSGVRPQMTGHMTHEEYVQSVRRQAVDICSGILAGTIPLLEGCHSLASLRWEVEVDERDADFFTFAMISSEIDALPVGEVRIHWAPEALAALEPQIQSAIEWASPQALPACRSVVQRFGA